LSENKITINTNTTGGQDITFPLEHDHLGEFISKLLGQPQSIQRTIFGAIDINKAWIINVYNLLNQRITQQNGSSKLTEFTTAITFTDGYKKQFNSLAAFEAYNEPKALISHAVLLKLTYLIQFPSKDYPEKQEIIIYVSDRLAFNRRPITLSDDTDKEGFIEIEINHTERTWGDDIESILTTHIEPYVVKKSYFREKIFEVYILPFFIFFMLLTSFITPQYVFSSIEEKQINFVLSKYTDINQTINIPGNIQSSKLEALISLEVLQIELSKYKYLPLVASIILFFIIFLLSMRLSSIQHPSFVILTDASEKRKTKIIEKRKAKITYSILGFIVTIIGGIISGIIVLKIFTP